MKQLIRFNKVDLAPNASQKLIFEIPYKDFGYYNPSGQWVVEKGNCVLWIGNSEQKFNFTLK